MLRQIDYFSKKKLSVNPEFGFQKYLSWKTHRLVRKMIELNLELMVTNLSIIFHRTKDLMPRSIL